MRKKIEKYIIEFQNKKKLFYNLEKKNYFDFEYPIYKKSIINDIEFIIKNERNK